MSRPWRWLGWSLGCLLLVQLAKADDASLLVADPAGISAFGQRGYFRTWTAKPHAPGSLVIGSFFEFFQSSDFLVSGDENLGLGGRLVLSGVPVAGLEISGGLMAMVNRNTAFSPEESKSVGDPFLGARYGISLNDHLSLGGGIQVLFPTDEGTFQFSAAGISAKLMACLDYQPISNLVVSLNLGYHLDNSSEIFHRELNPAQRFALDFNPHDQLLVHLGAAWHLGFVSPFLEYGTAQALGADDLGFGDNPNWLTLGVRAQPFSPRTWTLFLAADIGLTGVRDVPQGKARIAPYRIILALAYHLDSIFRPEQRASDREVIRVVETETGPRIIGQVLDAETGTPLGGARIAVDDSDPVTLLSEEKEGRFVYRAQTTGPLKLTASFEGYLSASEIVPKTEKEAIRLIIELRRAGALGILKGTVKSVTGKPLKAVLSIPTRGLTVNIEEDNGEFQFETGAGVIDVVFSMEEYESQQHRIELGAGETVIVHVELYPKIQSTEP